MTIADQPSPTFSGERPGQKLAEIICYFNEGDICTVLGEDVVSLITSLSEPECITGRLRRAVETTLRAQEGELMIRDDIREICLKAMPSQKRQELTRRLRLKNLEGLNSHDVTQDAMMRAAYLGFFGIDKHSAVPFSRAPDRENIHPKFGLFPHQRDAAQRVGTAIRGGHGRVVLHMPTGAGKTRTAMHIVSQVLASSEPSVVVWLAASGELLDQAADAFQDAWSTLGNREIEVVRFWKDHAPDLSQCSDSFVVAGLQKMHGFMGQDLTSFRKLGKVTGLVVVDEAHQAIAPTYRSVIDTLANIGQKTALLGLTATPGRTWADIVADEQLADFFDGRKIMLEAEGWDNPVSYLCDQGYLAKPEFHRLEVSPSSEFSQYMSKSTLGEDYDPELLDILARDMNRNAVILDEIRRLIASGHKRIIFFGASVRHAELITAVLVALDVDAKAVTGHTETSNRARIIRSFRNESSKPMVLCNFGVLTTGFDAPNTSAAVIARPTKSLVLFSQMVGRAIRGLKAGGNETCTVSTVIDIDLPGFGDVAEAFTNWEDVWHEPN